jgi:hypothetical protein
MWKVYMPPLRETAVTMVKGVKSLADMIIK